MKRIVTVLKTNEIYAHQFSAKDIAMVTEQFSGVRFLPDSVGVHLVVIDGINPLGIAQAVVNWLTGETGETVFYEGGFAGKFGSTSASGGMDVQHSERSFFARDAGILATPYLPSPYAT